jgi:hypothetical protein
LVINQAHHEASITVERELKNASESNNGFYTVAKAINTYRCCWQWPFEEI